MNNILNKEKVYAGVIGVGTSTLFCSGAGFWISKDICNFIIENEKNLDFKLNDDVSIGNFLYKKNIKLIKLNRFDILRNKRYLFKNIINNHYHIRIKNIKNRNNDLIYFKHLTNILYK